MLSQSPGETGKLFWDYSLIFKAIRKRTCCTTPAKSEVNPSKIKKTKSNQKEKLIGKENSLKKDTSLHQFQLSPKLQGCALKPEDADLYFSDLEFDGVGNIIGAKSQLAAEEVEAIKSITVSSLNSTNSAIDRTHSKTPVESLLYFNNYLGNAFPDEVVERWQDNIREFWLRGNMSPDRLKSFYQLALNDFTGDHVISREIGVLLTDLEKEKYPAQLYDNMFGRIFSSELGRELVENPSTESLETARILADKIKKDTENFSEYMLERMADILGSDNRFWFTKCPYLTVFINDPSAENITNCLTTVDNGFDVMKVSKLLMCMLLTKNSEITDDPYLIKAIQFYVKGILPIRTANNVINTTLINKKTDEKIIVEQNREFKTNTYGSNLRFQPRNSDTRDFIYSRSVSNQSSINHETPSIFEKNMLRSGQSFGIGISGTTNLSCFFYEGLTKENDEFSKGQAFLNTLAFILYDGGHSILESLAVFKAVSHMEQTSFSSVTEKHNKGKEIVESSLVNYKDLIKCGSPETQEYILNSLNKAYDKMSTSYEKHAYSAINSRE